MTLKELSKITGTDIIITWYCQSAENWVANLASAEISDGSFLTSEYGRGPSPNAALRDYVQNIRGKRLVINASSKEHRQEFDVPETLGVE